MDEGKKLTSEEMVALLTRRAANAPTPFHWRAKELPQAAALLASQAAGLARVTALAQSRLEDVEIHCAAADKWCARALTAEADLARVTALLATASNELNTAEAALAKAVEGEREACANLAREKAREASIDADSDDYDNPASYYAAAFDEIADDICARTLPTETTETNDGR